MRSYIRPLHLLFFIAVLFQGCENNRTDSSITITGEFETWKTITLNIKGPYVHESDAKNPFLDYRLNVLFIQGEDSVLIPGFFAADGNSAETSAGEGNIWKVHFTPYKEGIWSYTINFREGKDIAVNDSLMAGNPLNADGISDEFSIQETDKTAPGFPGKGRLQYTGQRYLQHTGSGEFFIKGGTDSPENFLAYEGFDNTPPHHKYGPHVRDWNPGNPIWKGSKGKGIIGALNYLASEKMNVVYFLTMNVLGDGDDVFPWTGRNERYRFDCSKLDQWEIVFDHFDRLGIVMHVVTQENENQVLLDAGFTDVQRKLYYRELVARFSHHLGLIWNMGEENGPATFYHNLGQSVEQRLTMAEYLRKIDPYNNLIVFHTMSADPELNDLTAPLLGSPDIDGLSLQIFDVYRIHEQVKKWVSLSADSGRQWAINLDEIGPWYRGLVADSEDPGHDTIRTQALWGTYMAGGAGTEWYLGPEDLTTEDFRTRKNMWDQTRIAMNFFRNNIPFQEMVSSDDLVVSGEAWCFAKKNEIYVIYVLDGKSASIDLSGLDGEASLSWFNPREEQDEIISGNLITGGRIVNISPAPSEKMKDWVGIIRKIQVNQ